MTPIGPAENCPTCGAPRLPNAQYCGECGSPFPLAPPPAPGGAWSQPIVPPPPTEARWPAPAGATGHVEQEAAHRAFFGEPGGAIVTEPPPPAPARRPGPGQIIPSAGSLGPAGEPPPERRRGLLLILIGVIVLLVLLGAVFVVLTGDGDDAVGDDTSDATEESATGDTGDPDENIDEPVVTQGPPVDGPDDELELLWTFQSPATLVSSASATDGTVYTATANGQVYAVEAASGVQRWTRNFDPEPIGHAPVVGPGVVVVQTTSGSSAGVLRGLDPATGADRWALDTSAPPDPTNPAVAVVGNVGVAALNQPTGVDLETGQVLWQTPTSPEDAPFALVGADDERAFIVTLNERLQAYNAADGTQLWSIELDDAPLLGAAAVGGTLVVADEADDGTRVRGLDAATGEERWNASVDEPAGSVTAAGDTVVVASDAELVAFTANDGEERYRLDNSAGQALVTAFDTRLYLAGFEVEIHDRDSGALIGTVPQPDVTDTPVVVAGEQVIVVSGARLYALE
ncbi:MAG: PQQ-binding-like beta-propeller repeat protein [Acidimicrobiales bacterium]